MNRCGDIESFVPPHLPAKSNPAVGIGLASRLEVEEEVGGEAEQGDALPPRTSDWPRPVGWDLVRPALRPGMEVLR